MTLITISKAPQGTTFPHPHLHVATVVSDPPGSVSSMTTNEQELATVLDLIAADKRITQFKGTKSEEWAYKMALNRFSPRLDGVLLALVKERTL